MDILLAVYDAIVGTNVIDNDDIKKLESNSNQLLKTRQQYIESVDEGSDIIYRKLLIIVIEIKAPFTAIDKINQMQKNI